MILMWHLDDTWIHLGAFGCCLGNWNGCMQRRWMQLELQEYFGLPPKAADGRMQSHGSASQPLPLVHTCPKGWKKRWRACHCRPTEMLRHLDVPFNKISDSVPRKRGTQTRCLQRRWLQLFVLINFYCVNYIIIQFCFWLEWPLVPFSRLTCPRCTSRASRAFANWVILSILFLSLQNGTAARIRSLFKETSLFAFVSSTFAFCGCAWLLRWIAENWRSVWPEKGADKQKATAFSCHQMQTNHVSLHF